MIFLSFCSANFKKIRKNGQFLNSSRLLLRTPGPVPFGTCICSYVETILSWTCHVYGPYEFRTSLGTSILLLSMMMIIYASSLSYNGIVIKPSVVFVHTGKFSYYHAIKEGKIYSCVIYFGWPIFAFIVSPRDHKYIHQTTDCHYPHSPLIKIP